MTTDTYTEVDFECNPLYTQRPDSGWVESGKYMLYRTTWTGKVTGRGRDRKNATMTQDKFIFDNKAEVKQAIKALAEAL